MRKLLFFLAVVATVAFTVTGRKDHPAVGRITDLYSRKVASLDSFLQAYPRYFYDSPYATRARKYEELAWFFKQSAGLIIYCEPELYYKKLVGPFHFEDRGRPGFFGILRDDWLFTGPTGNETDSALRHDLKKQDTIEVIDFLNHAVPNYRAALREANCNAHLKKMDASQLFDLLRMEIFRISTIDLANSDFDIDDAAMPSLNGSMACWMEATGEFVKELPEGSPLRARWTTEASGARRWLAENRQYADFNRMEFTRRYLIPLSRLLVELQQALEVPFLQKNSALRSDAKDIYADNIFNADFFAPSKDAGYTAARAELGRILFFDPLLSDNNQRACASCHKPEMAFTDGLKKSIAFDRQDLPRNSPTVINAGFQKKQFWDMRAASMEDQLDSVVNNADELHSSFEHVVEKLNASAEYKELFRRAFSDGATINRRQIKIAIGVYERTLTGLNSRFDQYMRGDSTRLSTSEINGFNVYMGKAKCGFCHVAPLFNGTLPPFFDLTNDQAIGVPVKDTMKKYVVDPDRGVMKINRDSFARFSFKVPTVRNAALTAPYMHNGVYKTLEQVVDFYDGAGGSKFIRDMRPDMGALPFFTILPIPLQLTATEKTDLVAFMKALTDTTASSNVPHRLPKLEGRYAKLNGRKVGGEY